MGQGPLNGPGSTQWALQQGLIARAAQEVEWWESLGGLVLGRNGRMFGILVCGWMTRKSADLVGGKRMGFILYLLNFRVWVHPDDVCP